MSKIFLFIASFFLFCSSCKKETGVQGPAGAAGTNGQDGSFLDTGTISGNLAVYNEFSITMPDSGGVNISLNVNGASRTTTSDAAGNYFFHAVPGGTYDLIYQKDNFGTMKEPSITHIPGSNLNTVVQQVYVIQNPVKTAVDSIRLDSSYSYVILHIYLDTSSITYQQYQYNFALFISNDPNPGLANASPSALNEFIVPDGSGAYTLIIDRGNLGGISGVGGPYYINVGVYNRYLQKFDNPSSTFDPGSGSYYVEPSDGKFVFPNLKMAPHPLKVR